jgi:O-6-methylguanine DNA methyltransferase
MGIETTTAAGEAALERDLAGLRSGPAPGFELRVLEQVGIVDDYAPADTVLGTVYVAYNRRGVSRVTQAESADEFEELFVGELGRPLRRAGLPRPVGRALESGDGTGLDYDLRGLTDYWRSVLAVTLHIPRGEVRSYTWVASAAGRPRAVRAAGSALAGNPVPLLIPCHRVVRQDGHIGNYGLGGPANKRRLLGHEGLDPDELERLATRRG